MTAGPIEPEDIERAVFKERFRGYDQDQVDRFLDQVAASLAALRAERDELAAQVEAQRGGAPLPAAPAAAGDNVDALISRTLSAAQRTAEELVEDARHRAAEIVRDAQERAGAARQQAEMEADMVRRAAGELRSFREGYRERLHAIMSEQLAALDRAGELPRLPAAVERLGDTSVAPAAAPPRQEPSPARAWAAAAAADVEEPEAVPGETGEEADGLASPWDELWRQEDTPPAHGDEPVDVQASPSWGTQPSGGALGDLPEPGGASTEHAGDA